MLQEKLKKPYIFFIITLNNTCLDMEILTYVSKFDIIPNVKEH